MKKSRKIILLTEIVAIIIVAIVLIFRGFNSKVVDSLTLEAGKDDLSINSFLIDTSKDGEFITDITTIDLKKPGKYDVKIKLNNKEYSSVIEIIDTISPKAVSVNVISPLNRKVDAINFVKNIVDNTEVTVKYETEPDFSKIGEHEVTVVLEDMGQNRTEIDSKLTVINLKDSVQREAGSSFDIKPEDFLLETEYNISFKKDISNIDLSRVSVQEIELLVNNDIVKADIVTVDTTPPVVSIVNLKIWKGDKANAMSFISEIEDASSVNVCFKTEPDFTKTGNQFVELLVEDAYKNITEARAILTILEDNEPPKITGVRDKTVYLDQTVSYRKGVYVTDNRDKDVQLDIDSSDVNIKKEGTYKVVYTATDLSGNESEKTISIKVIKQTVSEETVYNLIDEILEEITTENMTKQEKAHEIYKWIRSNIGYYGTSDINDWLSEAYKGLTTGYGDCFTYYIVSEIFLTRAGIDNMMVKRVGGRSNHYWNLINCGDGWYHFDSCTHIDRKDTFMMTDADLERFTKQRGINYYVFDRTQYPRTPVE